jgi:hypothetical protein
MNALSLYQGGACRAGNTMLRGDTQSPPTSLSPQTEIVCLAASIVGTRRLRDRRFVVWFASTPSFDTNQDGAGGSQDWFAD